MKRLIHAPAVYKGLTANGYGWGPRPSKICRQSHYSRQLWCFAYSLDDRSEVLIGALYSTQYFPLPMRKTGRFTIRLLSPSLAGPVKVGL